MSRPTRLICDRLPPSYSRDARATAGSSSSESPQYAADKQGADAPRSPYLPTEPSLVLVLSWFDGEGNQHLEIRLIAPRLASKLRALRWVWWRTWQGHVSPWRMARMFWRICVA